LDSSRVEKPSGPTNNAAAPSSAMVRSSFNLAVAHYLGHRNLQSTARYTALAPDRFATFWQG
jgi:site-specific recombinase XerC